MAILMMWWRADEARCPYCRCRFLRRVSRPGFLGKFFYPAFGLHVYRCIDCMTDTLLTRRAASEIPPENPALDPKKVLDSLDKLRETPSPETARAKTEDSTLNIAARETVELKPRVAVPIRPSPALTALRKAWLQASDADRAQFLEETNTSRNRASS